MEWEGRFLTPGAIPLARERLPVPTGRVALGSGENSGLFLRTRVPLAAGDRVPSADLEEGTPPRHRAPGSVCLLWPCPWERLTPSDNDTPPSPLSSSRPRPPGRRGNDPASLSVLGTLRTSRTNRVSHFFPTPLVTLDLECRLLLREEWLSLLPGCLSSEPAGGTHSHCHLSPWLTQGCGCPAAWPGVKCGLFHWSLRAT